MSNVLAIALLATPAAAAECEVATELPALISALDEAEAALAVLDISQFQEATWRAEAVLICLNEPVGRHEAARMHRVVALRAFGARDPLSSAAFAAARALEPSYQFPRSLVPRGSPVLEAYAAIDLDALTIERLPVPDEGWIELDGHATVQRRAGLPLVFHRFSGDGSLVQTAYLLPEEAPRLYVAAPLGTEMVIGRVLPRQPTWWQRQTLPLAVATGGTAVVTATLWGLSLHGRGRFADVGDNPVADEDLAALRARTNALAVGSGLGLGLTGLSATLFFTTW